MVAKPLTRLPVERGGFFMHILITYKDGSVYGKSEELFHYTEVHYNYPPVIDSPRVAFESDIEGTGFTRPLSDIEQIEVFQEGYEDQKQADE